MGADLHLLDASVQANYATGVLVLAVNMFDPPAWPRGTAQCWQRSGEYHYEVPSLDKRALSHAAM